jgi:hypothetical protein
MTDQKFPSKSRSILRSRSFALSASAVSFGLIAVLAAQSLVGSLTAANAQSRS